MRMIKMKKVLLAGLVMVFCSVSLFAQAQQATFLERWAAGQTKKYTEDLGLNEQQAKEVNEVLLTTGKKIEEIKAGAGDEKTKNQAIWRVQAERKSKIEAIAAKSGTAKTFADTWAANQTKKYTEDLGLSEQQAKKVHEVLLTSAKKAEEIKNGQGDEKTKNQAVWRIGKERNDKLSTIFTPEQNAKLKEIQAEEKRKKQAGQ